MEIKINKVGRIINGQEKGWFVKVFDDSVNTGGYLIFTFNSLDSEKLNYEIYDSWVENLEDLKAYFIESSWEIEWLQEED